MSTTTPYKHLYYLSLTVSSKISHGTSSLVFTPMEAVALQCLIGDKVISIKDIFENKNAE